MLYLSIVALPVVLSILILCALGVMMIVGKVSALHRKRKTSRASEAKIAEEVSWVDTVDRTIGISELLKGRKQ